LCSTSLSLSRHVNIIDSRVVLGCWAKGRSSSFMVNGVLRKCLGMHVFGGKLVLNFWVKSEENPSDPPSRFRTLWTPCRLEPQDDILLVPEHDPRSGIRPVRFCHRLCKELYAGRGSLSHSLATRGLLTGIPFEAFPDGGGYRELHDLHLEHVLDNLRCDIVNGVYMYLHFGIPCTTWGAAARLNSCSRTQSCPQGNGTIKKEVIANLEVDQMLELIALLLKHGGYFSIENPFDSYIFKYAGVVRLRDSLAHPCFFIGFDQCCFGLQLPGAAKGVFCRKRTGILTNVSELNRLAIFCPRLHVHEQAWGTRNVNGHSVKLCKAAGAYPALLCDVWAACIFSLRERIDMSS
jgi:hypothetical protein